MNIIVCIGNNLQHDTRVKRHISALLDKGHHVHVVAFPEPNNTFGMAEKNLTYSFVDFKYTDYPITPVLRRFLEKYKIWKKFLSIFPFLNTNKYYDNKNIIKYKRKLDLLISGNRWEEITGRKAEPMPDDQALSYPLIFLDKTIQFVKEVLKYDADCILCNDEDTLLCGVIHKIAKGTRFVYDFHDLMSDISDGVFPQIYSNFLALFEKTFIKYADAVMSVSVAELEWTKKHYGFRQPAIAMLNCSDVKLDSQIHKKSFNKKLRIYFHGIVGPDKGLWEMIKILEDRDDFEFIIRGIQSDFLDQLKDYVKDKNLNNKIHFKEPVSPKEIPAASNKDGDIGYSFINYKECINWECALTNKFIEYCKGGLPIITSAAKEQARIIKEYHNGWVLEDNSINSIKNVLNAIIRDKEKLSEMSDNSFKVANEIFDWNNYKQLFVDIIVGNKHTIEKNNIHYKNNYLQLFKWEIEDLINRLRARR